MAGSTGGSFSSRKGNTSDYPYAGNFRKVRTVIPVVTFYTVDRLPVILSYENDRQPVFIEIRLENC